MVIQCRVYGYTVSGIWLYSVGYMVTQCREYGYTVSGIWLHSVGYMVIQCRVYGYTVSGIWLYSVGYMVIQCRVYGYTVSGIWLYSVGYMVKHHSDGERGNLQPHYFTSFTFRLAARDLLYYTMIYYIGTMAIVLWSMSLGYWNFTEIITCLGPLNTQKDDPCWPATFFTICM